MASASDIQIHPVPALRQHTDALAPSETHSDTDDKAIYDPIREQGTAGSGGNGGSEGEEKKVWVTTRQENIMMTTICVSMFIAGWGDGSTGPLIPSLQEHYHVNYVVVSLIFVLSVVGFLTAALTSVYVTDYFGFGRVLVIAGILQTIGYALICWSPPFGMFVVMFMLITAGAAWQDAQTNGIVNRFSNPDLKMGLLHAAYGLGATCAPLIATVFASHVSKFWTFYAVSAGLSFSSALLQWWIFRLKRVDELLGPAPGEEDQEGKSSSGKMKEIMRQPTVHLLGFFLLMYVGLEVSIGGWIVSYIEQVRGGNATSGYIASGYWGGLTVGRVVLVPINRWLGDAWAIYVYMIICIGFEMIVWFVPNIIANGVAISFVGLFLGPMYPMVMRVCGKVFPASIVTGVIGWASSFGAAGAAVAPFITGAVSEKFGVKALQPVLVIMMGLCFLLWVPIPKKPKVPVQEVVDEKA